MISEEIETDRIHLNYKKDKENDFVLPKLFKDIQNGEDNDIANSINQFKEKW